MKNQWQVTALPDLSLLPMRFRNMERYVAAVWPTGLASSDLAPLVGASLEVMDSDTRRMHGDRPYVFANPLTGEGVPEIADFIVQAGGLPTSNAV